MDQKLFLQQKILNHRNRIKQAKRLRFVGWEETVSQLEAELRMVEADLEACMLVAETAKPAQRIPLTSLSVVQMQQQQQQQGGLLPESRRKERWGE